MEDEGYKVKCSYLITTPDACGECPLNPRNQPAPSARLQRLLRIRGWQAAGAQLKLNDLPPRDWDDLAVIEGEIKRHEIERMKKR